ncbi:hypothetical protein Tco_1067653 [Tanacetum coccineum]|uniref:Uncharacterized protein n=1 Tax=Tanacetum coccineum TaxID=301880 RepID=A0ABQ5HDI5_9ASTR
MEKTLKTNKDKDLKILEQKTKSKDNDKGSRSNITKHEGTSLQQDKDQNKDSRTKRQNNLNKSKEVRFKDLASGKIVSLKILSASGLLTIEIIEHVAQGCIRVIFVTGEAYGIFTDDGSPLLEFIFKFGVDHLKGVEDNVL